MTSPRPGPTRSALPARVLAAYLLLTLLPLAASGAGWTALLVGAAHVAAAALLPRASLRLPVLPLLAVPALYAELPLLMRGVGDPVRYHDDAVSGLEAALFGGQPAFDWAGAMPWTGLSELLHLGYLLYYALIYVPPLLLWWWAARPREGVEGAEAAGRAGRALDQSVLALVLAFTSCYLVMVVFPVQGPRYLGAPPGVPDGPVRRLVLGVLEAGSSRGAAFPSSHVAVAVAQAWVTVRRAPRMGAWVAAVTVPLTLGTVYGGFHYAVDAAAGLLFGLAAGAVATAVDPRPAGFTPPGEAV